jgi:hypothetical protein
LRPVAAESVPIRKSLNAGLGVCAGLKRLAAEHGEGAAREARREREERAAGPIADCTMGEELQTRRAPD